MPSITDSRCILVIGSTAGIGRALALAILDLPSKPTVIVCGRRKERLDELVASHGAAGRLKSITLDVLAERNALKVSIQEIVNAYPDVRVPSIIPPQTSVDILSSLMPSCSRMASNVPLILPGQKPLISTVRLFTIHYDLLILLFLRSALECELATNYTSIVRMITFFLPHLIKLGV